MEIPSVKEEAMRLLRLMSDDCTWDDVLRALSIRAGKAPGVVREFRAPYAPEAYPTSHPDTETETMGTFFDVVIERDPEGYYVGSVPALQGCHTQAGTVEQLMERVREAIALCVEVSGGERTGTEVVGIRRIAVPV